MPVLPKFLCGNGVEELSTLSSDKMYLKRVWGPVVLASDEAFAMPLATTLRSIIEANRRSWPLEFHVLADGVCEDTRLKVSNSLPNESATIRWVPVDVGFFSGFSTESHVSKVTYARLLIPRIFPTPFGECCTWTLIFLC